VDSCNFDTGFTICYLFTENYCSMVAWWPVWKYLSLVPEGQHGIPEAVIAFECAWPLFLVFTIKMRSEREANALLAAGGSCFVRVLCLCCGTDHPVILDLLCTWAYLIFCWFLSLYFLSRGFAFMSNSLLCFYLFLVHKMKELLVLLL